MISPQALHLGPIMLPWSLLIAILSLILALWLTGRARAKFGISDATWNIFKDSIWNALWIGMIAARLVFVALNYPIYLEHPWDIFKIQDKGFHFIGGMLAAVAWLIWKNRQAHIAMLAIFLSLLLTFSMGSRVLLDRSLAAYQQFPQVELSDQHGRTILLPQYIGKATVINLWASWCPPCHREMPVLQQAQQDYPDVQFVMINQGEDLNSIQSYLEKNQLAFQHLLLDPEGKTAQATGMYGLPSTLFFNAQGQLIETHMGEISQAVLKQKIAAINETMY
ncbi:thiol-disulfide isomerase/thioredoxin [Acinetobacter calcoaceticus]|uniref:Thiol-disulfide isomerase/thioredoxin n=1 Tax=Acinetobacter calcoaceticus TaxID=471 RepID=A0A4R1XEJ1_ACICA|nr:thiol-disulfide isomerase/thioredoxin [Acinetobacter calcoaceticus]